MNIIYTVLMPITLIIIVSVPLSILLGSIIEFILSREF